MYKISTLVYQLAGLAAGPEYGPLLREFLRKPQDHGEAILGLTRCDVGLTASILRCCNAVNSYYGTESVGTLEEAEVRLGLDPIVEVITKLATKEVYQLPREAEIHLAELWDHCLLTGVLTRRLADHCPDPAELAFTAGLLHDIGKLFIIKIAPRMYSQTLAAAAQGHKTCAAQEQEDFENNHARIGAEVLERWKLPRNLVQAISRHHHPQLNATQYPLAGCIALADTLAHHSLEQSAPNLNLCLDKNASLLQELGLDATELATVLQEGQAQFTEIKRQVTSSLPQPLSE